MVDVLREKSNIDGEERSSEQVRTRAVRPAAVIVILLCICTVPALYRPSQAGKLRFDPDYITQLNAIRPDYVWIGNSMLGTRIDQAVLEEKLGENCCYVMSTGGAESAWEHQALKNHVLAANHLPKKVFIFFRDTYLTRPSYRAQDIYWWRIERLSHDDEPELERAMRATRTWQEELEYQLGRVYPLQKRRVIASGFVETFAGWLASGQSAGPESAGSRYNELFGLEKMRLVESDDTAFDADDPAHYDFPARVGESLLPSMIAHARRKGVELVFVRVQRRPTPQGPRAESPELRAYLAALQAYLQQNNAIFYDFTGDPELTLDRYLDGDHIRPEWKRGSTEHFVLRLQDQFR